MTADNRRANFERPGFDSDKFRSETYHSRWVYTCWRENVRTMFTKVTLKCNMGNTFVVNLNKSKEDILTSFIR